jgi:hypothetical protein
MVETIKSSERPALTSLMMASLLRLYCAVAIIAKAARKTEDSRNLRIDELLELFASGKA